jgi:hypothetical protein
MRATSNLAIMNSSRPLIRLKEIAQNSDIKGNFIVQVLQQLSKEALDGFSENFGTGGHSVQSTALKMPGECYEKQPFQSGRLSTQAAAQ